MSMHVIRKALGLLIVDIVLIIGIFVLQFRTDSTIIEKIGNLQVSLELDESQENEQKLKNKLQISYNGINLFCNDQNPAQISYSGSNEKENLVLQSWEKNDLSYKFNFSEDVSFTVSISSEEPDASFSTSVSLPANISNFYLPYNFNYSMKIQKEDDSKIVVDGKKSSWEISAANLSSNLISFNKNENYAKYSIYDDTVNQFSFEKIAEQLSVTNQTFQNIVNNLKTNLISSFKTNLSDANLSEQAVVSYIAAQAENGNYVSAIEEIPQSFKKGNLRTYLSTPYLNNLEEMNVSLNKAISENANRITKTASNFNFDIFTTKNIAFFMYIHPNKNEISSILQQLMVSDLNNANLSQINGILRFYLELSEYDKNLASILLPILENCLHRIEESCNYDGTIFTISENDTFLSVIQAVEIGTTLIRYGNLFENQIYTKIGYAIVKSYINESSSFDLRTLSNIYPILAFNNWYYPHFEKIETNDGRKLWAWTCAKEISYTSENKNSMSLRIDFPENYTHYVIFKGIPSFKSIYIYNMAFRTDPRFETYNSSGYVYKSSSETLLLKSRHKQRFETVSFDFYTADDVTTTPKIVAPKQEEKTVEANTSENDTETQNQIDNSEQTETEQPSQNE